MKRSGYLKRTPLQRSKPMRRKPTRPKSGQDPQYLAWLRTLPCAHCSKPPPSEPSHERFKGLGLALKAPDSRAWPSCRPCHRLYESREGIFADATRQQWTDATCDLLQEAYLRCFGLEPELREEISG